MTHDDSSDGIDRRTFLGGAAGAGAAAGLPGLPGDGGDGFEAPDGEVPYVAARRHTNHAAVAAGEAPPEREPVWASMPVARWLRFEAANAAERRVNAMLRERSASDLVRAGTRPNGNGELIVDVHVVALETTRGDVLTPDVNVDRLRTALPSTARGRGELPRERRGGLGSLGTPTREREHEVAWTRVRHEQQCGDFYAQRYRPVPGGAAMTSEGGGCATTCTPALDRNTGEYVMVTAGHAIGGTESGRDVVQPSDDTWYDNRIGESLDAVVQTDSYGARAFDAATIMLSDASPTYDLAAENSTGYATEVDRIAGVIDWRTIEQDKDAGEEYRLQGANSGRLTGSVVWTSNFHKLYEISARSQKGDSGGPHFKELVDGNAYIAGVHNYGETGGRAGATWIREAEDRFDVIV